MTPRPQRVTPERLIDEAAALVDSEGLAALSLARLAARLGIRSPSLYNHIDSLDEVRYRLALRGLGELVDRLRVAGVGRAGSEALLAIAHAYRDFARRHPGLYALGQISYEGRDDRLQALGRDAVEVVLGVLRGYGLEGGDALHATRTLRSALAGFVHLELNGGFGLPLDVDESFARLVALLDRGLRG